jgi:hypothetical protein
LSQKMVYSVRLRVGVVVAKELWFIYVWDADRS